MELKKLCSTRKKKFDEVIKGIEGYQIEAKSHNAIAAAIAHERADCGLGIEIVSDQYNLDFIPVRKEMYDFAIPKSKVDKREVQLFLEVLNSKNFKKQLNKMIGLETSEETGKKIFG